MLFFTIIPVSLFLSRNVFAAPISLGVEASLSRRVTHSGKGTFFYPGLGNCGERNGNSDPIVAISTQIYHEGANCNQWVQITNTQNNKKAFGLVRDSCPSCAQGSLDMSPAVFKQLAPLSKGVISIDWHYMHRGFTP